MGFANRFRALWSICMPHLEARVENGRSTLLKVQRDGRVLLPATAAVGMRHLQELRGSLARRFHGRERRCDVGQGRELREEGGGRKGRQEEMSKFYLGRPHSHVQIKRLKKF